RPLPPTRLGPRHPLERSRRSVIAPATSLRATDPRVEAKRSRSHPPKSHQTHVPGVRPQPCPSESPRPSNPFVLSLSKDARRCTAPRMPALARSGRFETAPDSRAPGVRPQPLPERIASAPYPFVLSLSKDASAVQRLECLALCAPNLHPASAT